MTYDHLQLSFRQESLATAGETSRGGTNKVLSINIESASSRISLDLLER